MTSPLRVSRSPLFCDAENPRGKRAVLVAESNEVCRDSALSIACAFAVLIRGGKFTVVGKKLSRTMVLRLGSGPHCIQSTVKERSEGSASECGSAGC